MGLDVYHAKACMEQKIKGDVLYLCDFSEEAIVEYGFHAYIQDVPDIKHLHTIFFFNTLPDLKRFEESNQDTYKGVRTLVVGSWVESKSEIALIEEKNRLLSSQTYPAQRIPFQGNDQESGYSYEYASYYKEISRLGLFYEEVGYQRNGLREEFTVYYRPDFIHVRKRCFLDMLRYLHRQADDVDRSNINDNFISNYEAGRSMLLVY